jgi:hypothetical protein
VAGLPFVRLGDGPFPGGAFPRDLEVDNLSGYTYGWPPILNYPSIDDNQLWGGNFGPI